jgi:hypothetical protein
MAETTQLTFEHKEIIELMLRNANISEGIWQLQLSLGLAGGNVGLTPEELNPAAIVMIQKFGLIRVTDESLLTVDASKLKPKKLSSSKAPSSR